MKDINSILESLGLLESEINTYMTSLQNGPSSVIDLSKETGLSRQGVYTAIQSLGERGLMSSVKRDKKTYYAAEGPEKLLDFAKRKQEEVTERTKELKKILPELELKAGGEKPVVRLYEGKEGIKVLLEDTRQSKPKQLDEITDDHAVSTILTDDDVKEYRETLKKIKTNIRSIGHTNTGDEPHVKRISLPKNKQFKSHISIHGNKITLMTFEGKMHSIIIESLALADAMRILFDKAFSKK